jgi:hypothetical protein
VSPKPKSTPTGSGAGNPTASPTAAGSPTDCTASATTVSVTTDKSSYTSGQQVQVTVTLTNNGPPCYAYTQNANIKIRKDGDPADTACRPTHCGVLPNTGGGSRQLLAFGAHFNQLLPWDRTKDSGGPAATGTYTVTATWADDTLGPGTTYFTLAS